jgi:hypothetical protein
VFEVVYNNDGTGIRKGVKKSINPTYVVKKKKSNCPQTVSANLEFVQNI